MIIIAHGGHFQSTTSIGRAALGHLFFASCDPAHLPGASNDWRRLAADAQVG